MGKLCVLKVRCIRINLPACEHSLVFLEKLVCGASPMLGPYPDALSEWGGKNSTLIVADGQWWRLITPIMLHAGIIHLAGTYQSHFHNKWKERKEKETTTRIECGVYTQNNRHSHHLSLY